MIRNRVGKEPSTWCYICSLCSFCFNLCRIGAFKYSVDSQLSKPTSTLCLLTLWLFSFCLLRHRRLVTVGSTCLRSVTLWRQTPANTSVTRPITRAQRSVPSHWWSSAWTHPRAECQTSEHSSNPGTRVVNYIRICRYCISTLSRNLLKSRNTLYNIL